MGTATLQSNTLEAVTLLEKMLTICGSIFLLTSGLLLLTVNQAHRSGYRFSGMLDFLLYPTLGVFAVLGAICLFLGGYFRWTRPKTPRNQRNG